MDYNGLMKSTLCKLPPFGMKFGCPKMSNGQINSLWRPFMPSMNQYGADLNVGKVSQMPYWPSFMSNRFKFNHPLAQSLSTWAMLQQMKLPNQNNMLPAPTSNEKHSSTMFPSMDKINWPAVHLVKLSNGRCKRMEDITEVDLVESCDHGYLSQWSLIESISNPDEETKKVTICFNTAQKKSYYTCDLSKPLFVQSRGWCSVLPVLTLRIYGIPVGQLQPGNICITLTTKTTKSSSVSTTNQNPTKSRKRKSQDDTSSSHDSSSCPFDIDHLQQDNRQKKLKLH